MVKVNYTLILKEIVVPMIKGMAEAIELFIEGGALEFTLIQFLSKVSNNVIFFIKDVTFNFIKDGMARNFKSFLKAKCDEYYVAYKPITLPCISFKFIEIKFIHYHTCVMFQ